MEDNNFFSMWLVHFLFPCVCRFLLYVLSRFNEWLLQRNYCISVIIKTKIGYSDIEKRTASHVRGEKERGYYYCGVAGNTEGQLFTQSLARVLQNRILSHLQFA